MKKFRLRKFYLGLVTFIILLYMEITFRILTGNTIFSKNIIYVLIFNLSISLFYDLLGRIFNRKTNKIIFLVNIFLVSLLYSIQFCVFRMFSFYFDFGLLGASGQVVSFAKDGINLVLNNIIGVILLFLPFILFSILNYLIIIEKQAKKITLIKSSLCLASIGSFYLFLRINKNEINSPYKLYYKINNVDLNVRTFGVLNTFFIDSYRLVFNFKESVDIIENINDDKTNKNTNNVNDIAYEYNNLDIDFDDLIKNESDDTIKSMHEYFKNESGTKQNKYTKYFEGKNLILFMAESFNEIAVREDLTPTLYKLVNSGFKFNNYYTPTISSTIGGEFQELTGLVAASGFVSPWKSGTNTYPMGIATVFKNLGYSTYAYHDHSIYFQDRYKYLKALGFDNFKGCLNGLEESINCNQWPESDVEMINATFDDYIKSDKPFFTYYATVSGHGGYTFSQSAMAKKHQEEVANLKYSEKPKAYLAAQIELDRALETLINKLKEAGKLDNTVIALVGDHYPYYLSIDEVNEISSYKKDEVVEVNKSNFILWNSEMETVNIDKVGSQIDVLPTIYNLFGASYDSRLIIGKDILSTEPGLAIFGNRSWVSDKGTYFAASGKFISKNKDEKISDEYISYMNNLVNNKMNMSKNIIVNDYYKKVLGDK